MMQRKRIFSALAAGVLSEIANKLFPLLTLHFVAQKLGVTSFGVSQFAQWLLDIAAFFIVFGYPNAGLVAWRNSDAKAHKEVFSASIILRLIHAMIAAAVLLTVLALNPSWSSYKLLVFQSLFVLLTSAIDGIWVMTAMGLLPLLSAISLITKTISIIVIFTFVRGPEDASIYTLATVAANSLVSLVTFGVVVRRLGWKWPNLSYLSLVFYRSLPYALSFILLIALERFDLAFVEHFAGSMGVGRYSGPAKIAQSLIPIAAMVTTVFFAEMLNIFDRDSTIRHLKAGLRVSFIFLMPIVVGFWFTDRQVIGMILGPNYEGDARLLSVLSTSILAHLLLLAFGNQILVLQDRVRFYNWALAIGLAAGVLGSLWVGLFHNDLLSFAVASCAGRWFAAFFVVWSSLSILGHRRSVIGEMVKSSLPALVMAGALLVLPEMNFISTVLSGALIYLVLILLIFRESLLVIMAKARSKLSV